MLLFMYKSISWLVSMNETLCFASVSHLLLTRAYEKVNTPHLRWGKRGSERQRGLHQPYSQEVEEQEREPSFVWQQSLYL